MVFVFILLGLLIGSFTNVIIYRLPIKKSILFPGSRCTSCNSDIKWYDNIPILSYLILRGKCRNCHQHISIQYPLIELLMGVLFGAIFLYLGLSYELFLGLAIVTIGVWIFFIDIKYYIIPNSLVISFIVIGVLNITYLIYNQNYSGVWDHFIGAFAGFFILLFIRWLGFLLYKEEAMGLGDVKLMFSLGLILGLNGMLLMLFLAITGSALLEVLLIVVKLKEKGARIAFGPYLIMALLVTHFFSDYILKFYLSLITV